MMVDKLIRILLEAILFQLSNAAGASVQDV